MIFTIPGDTRNRSFRVNSPRIRIGLFLLLIGMLPGARGTAQPPDAAVDFHQPDPMMDEMMFPREHHPPGNPMWDEPRRGPKRGMHERSYFYRQRGLNKMISDKPLKRKDLIRFNTQLDELKDNFAARSQELRQLSEEIGGAIDKDTKPEPDPKSVIKGPEIRRMLEKQHRLVGEMHKLRKRSVREIYRIAINHPQWKHLIETGAQESEKIPANILARWRKAHVSMENQEFQGFSVTMLGPPLGLEIHRRLQEALTRHSNTNGAQSGRPENFNEDRGLHRPGQEKLMRQLNRLERQNHHMQRMIHNQDEEIHRLKSILEDEGQPLPADLPAD
jgi:hypothetical protein